jgi:hypothetical protein
MPQLLIKSVQTGSGPGAYQRGHVVVVMPDDHVFGLKEGLPNFLVVAVPQSVVDDNPGLADSDTGGSTGLRRGKFADVDALPSGVLVALEASGRASLARGVFNAIVKRETRTPLDANVPAERAALLRNMAYIADSPAKRSKLEAAATALERVRGARA